MYEFIATTILGISPDELTIHKFVTEILGWTSIIFYIGITIFNSMKLTRFAAFGSTTNDVIWAALMGWWPKVILNISVTTINAYRYLKDFTKTHQMILNIFAAVMAAGVSYIGYKSVEGFIAEPTWQVALQYVDLALILLALYMTSLTKYRTLMLISGFVGMGAYFGSTQMMIIKALVILITGYKLITIKPENS